MINGKWHVTPNIQPGSNKFVSQHGITSGCCCNSTVKKTYSKESKLLMCMNEHGDSQRHDTQMLIC